jgi:hypothetical protein
MRVAVSILCVLVTGLAVMMSRIGVLLGFVVLPVSVIVCGLQVMVGSSVMVCRGLMVMLRGWMLRLLCHWSFSPRKNADLRCIGPEIQTRSFRNRMAERAWLRWRTPVSGRARRRRRINP